MAVVTWSVNHNPVGRALVLAELLSREFAVEVVGFDFPVHGKGVWEPVRDTAIPVRSFGGLAFPGQFELMRAVGRTLSVDGVVVSKPRLPGIAVAAFAKQADGIGVVVDSDDWELSFVGATEGVPLSDGDRIASDDTVLTPYGRIWTQVCDPLFTHADEHTVSNVALRERYGGSIVPHARDADLFDPARYDRSEIRARLGLDRTSKLLLFGGTPRRHKGVIELAQAVVELGDPTLVLGVIASPELRELRTELVRTGCRVVELEPQPFAAMPSLLAAADLTAVLQDPASPIARYQMPAKVTDALAMAVPCIVSDVPPLAPLIDAEHVSVVGSDGLTAALARVIGDLEHLTERARASRVLFLEQYSHDAVAPKLAALVRRAVENPRPLSSGWHELLDRQQRMFASARRPAAQIAPAVEPEVTSANSGSGDRARRRRRHRSTDGYDLVVFWKQNDSDIYGRRADLLIAEMAAAPGVARAVHFDAPLGIEALRMAGQTGALDHRTLIFDNTIRRVLGQNDDEAFSRHTFLYDDRGDRFDLPRRDEYGDFVHETLTARGIGHRDVVFWVYPTNYDAPDLIDRFAPDVVVADVVDDNRTWYPDGSAEYERLTSNYAAILSRSDVVLANCVAVQEAMSAFHPGVELLPNACEPPTEQGPIEPPEELAKHDGPIIGYVGNLSSRIDVDLIEYIAGARPDWTIVLIGSTHAGHEVLRAARLPNVLILGPRPYEEAKRFVRCFDVAIVPHLDNHMTRAMNPLKVFVYCSLGVPVVSTEIANLDELRDLITTASDPPDFLRAIDIAIRRGRPPLTDSQLALIHANSWPARAAHAQQLLDAALGRSGAA